METKRLLQGMTEATSQPAVKVQKSSVGDVAAASPPQVAVQDVTPDQRQAIGEQAAETQKSGFTSQKASSRQKEGGKKRKVALYVSYIGAGYHVSAGAGLTRQQRQHRRQLKCLFRF